MGEIRFVGPGKTCGYPYPVCKKTLYSRQSSAKSHSTEETLDGRSLLYTRNRRGLSTVPCGTPGPSCSKHR